MDIYIPYTYLIGWSKHNLWYYGCEFGNKSKTANPDNLWRVYFTSSKEVKKILELYGDPDVIQIRRKFLTKIEALNWEHKVLKRMKVIKKENWLNKTDNKAIYIDEQTQKLISQKISRALKGKKKSEEHISKLVISRTLNDQNDPSRKERRKNARIGKKQPKATKDKRNNKLKELIWITNGIENKRINKNETIPNNWIQGRTNERTEKQMSTIRELGRIQGKKNKGKLINDKNPASKRIIFRNIEYYSLRNASESTGISRYKIKKECIYL